MSIRLLTDQVQRIRKTRGKADEKSAGALHGSLIEDYCMIGECETAALVSREGSIDWLCWPTFSSGAVFAALLGIRGHGFWKISPIGEVWSIHRRYEPHPLVVETTFETREGEVCLIDFMPPRGEHSHVVRIVRGGRGKVAMKMELAIRFDYGRTIPWVTQSRYRTARNRWVRHGGCFEPMRRYAEKA